MAVLPIVVAPAKVLKTRAQEVEKVDATIAQLMDDMLDTMYDAPGIGLAANQIGQLVRVIVVDVADKESGESAAPLQMANPEVIWESDDLSSYQEGCLSLPDQYGDVERPASVKVRYLDKENNPQELEADGLLATCIQHEIDHLDGVLFVDHMSKLKRDRILKKLEKYKKLLASQTAAE